MKYLEGRPFSVAVCSSKLTDRQWFLIFDSKAEFCTRYKLTPEQYDAMLDELKKESN